MYSRSRSIHSKQLVIIALVLALLVALSIGVVSRYVIAGGSAPQPAANVLRPGAAAAQQAPAAPVTARERVNVPDVSGEGFEESSYTEGQFDVRRGTAREANTDG